MAFETRTQYGSRSQVEAAAIDVGLRQYMLGVYNYMASGLALTGIVALLVSSSPEMMQAIFGTPLKWVIMLAPLGLVFFLGARFAEMEVSTARGLFWATGRPSGRS